MDSDALKTQLAEVAAALRFDDIGMGLAASASTTGNLPSGVSTRAAAMPSKPAAFGLGPIEEEAARMATLKLQKQKNAELAVALAAEANLPPPPLPAGVPPTATASSSSRPSISASGNEDLFLPPTSPTTASAPADTTAFTPVQPVISRLGHMQNPSVSSISSVGSQPASPPVKLVYTGISSAKPTSPYKPGPASLRMAAAFAPHFSPRSSSASLKEDSAPTSVTPSSKRKAVPTTAAAEMASPAVFSQRTAIDSTSSLASDLSATSSRRPLPLASPATPGAGKPRRKPVPKSSEEDGDDDSKQAISEQPRVIATAGAKSGAALLAVTSLGDEQSSQLQGTINRALLARARKEEREREASSVSATEEQEQQGESGNKVPLIEGPGGNLITNTANVRWNSALREITMALAAEDEEQHDEMSLQEGLKAADEALARLGQVPAAGF